jgi:hypothetical protein
MKKHKTATPAASPDCHLSIGQLPSEVEGGKPFLQKLPSRKTGVRKAEPTVTIAPGLRSTRDIIINPPTPAGSSHLTSKSN